MTPTVTHCPPMPAVGYIPSWAEQYGPICDTYTDFPLIFKPLSTKKDQPK